MNVFEKMETTAEGFKEDSPENRQIAEITDAQYDYMKAKFTSDMEEIIDAYADYDENFSAEDFYTFFYAYQKGFNCAAENTDKVLSISGKIITRLLKALHERIYGE